jgi:hypothetical protein
LLGKARDLVAWCDAEAFMVEAAGQRRFRFSIRTLMFAVALCAVLIAPLVWMFRRVEMARLLAEQAREDALRLRDLAQLRSAQAGLGATSLSNTDQPEKGNFWAGLSVNHPIFKAGQTKDLRIEFTLVNDGDKVIDPKIAESRILINGKELAEPRSIFGSASKAPPFKALSPGESLQFGVLLGDQFKEPGTYRVSWKGAGFQSSEIVVRILPEKAP